MRVADYDFFFLKKRPHPTCGRFSERRGPGAISGYRSCGDARAAGTPPALRGT